MLSLESTITGRVFLISAPSVGSSRARTTSPRRAATTLLFVLENGPRLGVAHFPLSQQIAIFVRVAGAPPGVVGSIPFRHFAPLDRVEIGREHPGDDPASTRLRNQGIGPL